MAKKENKLKRPGRVLMYAYLGTLILSVVIVVRIYKIQNEWEPDPKFIKEFLPVKHLELTNPRRGSIIDHNGELLAISTPNYDIYMDAYVQKEHYDNDARNGEELNAEWLRKADAMSKGLATIIGDKGKDSTYYSRHIRKGRAQGKRNIVIAKDVDDKTLKKLMELPLFNEPPHKGGIKIEQKDKRMYPYGGLARRTIGYINENNPNGYVGIEGAYHRELRGRAGYKWAKRTDNFEWISDVDSIAVQVEDGMDVRTTLDINIQEIAERSLREHVDTVQHINSACAVVMDVKTGAVRAMVNLKRDSLGRMKESFNMAAGRPSEPGSIFKTVTLTTLLEDGLVKLDDLMELDEDKMIYPGFTRKERDRYALNYGLRHKTDYIPVIDGFMVSSNYVFRRQVVDHYMSCPEELINRLHSYNLGADFNFELSEPGSSRSSIPDPEDSRWSASTLPATAVGYAVMVTPLQILSFYNAIANEGKMMMPYIVESLEKEGKTVRKIEPELLNIVCSKETTDTLKRALKKVTHASEGTAYESMKGVKCVVAGKTGTAWIALEKDEKEGALNDYTFADDSKRYQGSFAGFFPADNPKYSAIVVVYTDPLKGKGEGGGNKPAKVFKNIVNELWAYDEKWRKEITVDGKIPESRTIRAEARSGGEIPDLSGMGLRDAVRIIESLGYSCDYTGVGHVTRQEQTGETIKLTLE